MILFSMRMRIGLALIALAILLSVRLLCAAPVDDALRAPQSVRAQACRIARWAITQAALGKPTSPIPFQPVGMLNRPSPCFVTIAIDGHRKGCMGNFEPSGDTLARNIVQTAVRAWGLDPRSKRLSSRELVHASCFVTIPGPRKRVSDPLLYPPANYGLLVESGGKMGVILPGEAKTGRWQISEAKRQAGLKQDAYVSFSVFRAVTFSEK